MDQLTIGLDKEKKSAIYSTHMAFRANIIKKIRRWLNRRADDREIYQRSSLSVQVGKLLQSRGSEIITMTTL